MHYNGIMYRPPLEADTELLNKAKPNAICGTNLYIFPHTKLAADVEKGIQKYIHEPFPKITHSLM